MNQSINQSINQSRMFKILHLRGYLTYRKSMAFGYLTYRRYKTKGVHPRGDASPQYFSRGDDNALITPNIGRNWYAIAIKHSMSGDGWQRRK